MILVEDPYGYLKRFCFFRDIITQEKPKNILEVGCGTGTMLLAPLAKTFPGVIFLGIDTDKVSIHAAQNKHSYANLTFSYQQDLNFAERFDLIIISEVLEHVADPKPFLDKIRSLLNADGKVILTIPNGYGPFEVMAFFNNILYFIGIIALLEFIQNLVKKKGEASLDNECSLAVSPHLNFFSYGQLKNLLSSIGFKIIRFQARSFLCGFILDRLLFSKRLLDWNVMIVDKLPKCLSSDWMFLLEKEESNVTFVYEPNMFSRLRRYMNKKRFMV